MNFFVAAVLLLTSTGFFTQKTTTPTGSPGEIKDALLQIEREIGRANLNCDFRYFERIEAEEFIFTDSEGKTSNKRDDLAGEKVCHKSDATYDLDDTDARLYPAAAVVTGRVTITRKKEGTTIVRRSRFTDVFVWRDNQWQLVAGHSSRIPDSPTAK